MPETVLATFVAAATLAAPRLNATVTVVGAVGEESIGSPGATEVATWPAPDFCVIGEPSGWDAVCLGYRGTLSFVYTLTQDSRHTAGPGESVGERAVAFWNALVAEVAARTGDPETMLEVALESAVGPPLLLVLDGVQDPHNLGACLRVADGAGAHAVIAPKDRSCGLTTSAIKVASGAADTVPYIVVTNLARTMRDLKDRGIWLVGADDSAPQSIYQAKLEGALGMVLGAEGEGLRRLTKESCDLLVSIPMYGAVESLNVSVASGIVLYEAMRRRHSA